MGDLEVTAGRRILLSGEEADVPGWGDLGVRLFGFPAGEDVEIGVGSRVITVRTDAGGGAEWLAPRLLGLLAGTILVRCEERCVTLRVRPDKLVSDAIVALVDALEAVSEGLAQSAGGLSELQLRSREQDLRTLDEAVGLAASAAPAIRRRPIHRAREVARAVAQDRPPSRAADVRWLATHPAAAIRAGAAGRPVGVHRDRRTDLDTPENRGVLAAYDQLERSVGVLSASVDEQIGRLEAARPAREAFVVDGGTLWSERDAPRHAAFLRRKERIAALSREVTATRRRAGLPDLRPRGVRMARTARVEAEIAYWLTWRASVAAARAELGQAPPAPAPVRSLDELWEQWVAVTVLRSVEAALGEPVEGTAVDPGWFATLRHGPIASWRADRRTITIAYEPAFSYGAGEIQKLHPGRPWRPDVVIEVRWADGTVELHVLDAKYRLENGGPPRDALQEIWWRYGDGIGRLGLPCVASVWAVAPGDGLWLVAPGMLRTDWPQDRLRGGVISIQPGREGALDHALRALLQPG